MKKMNKNSENKARSEKEPVLNTSRTITPKIKYRKSHDENNALLQYFLYVVYGNELYTRNF